jgi:hypothetical protein
VDYLVDSDPAGYCLAEVAVFRILANTVRAANTIRVSNMNTRPDEGLIRSVSELE